MKEFWSPKKGHEKNDDVINIEHIENNGNNDFN